MASILSNIQDALVSYGSVPGWYSQTVSGSDWGELQPGSVAPFPSNEWLRQQIWEQEQMYRRKMQDQDSEVRRRAQMEGFYKHVISNGSSPSAHWGEVKSFRREFKEYSKEDFRNISKEPVVKEILSGLATCPKEDIANRIKQHLEDMD